MGGGRAVSGAWQAAQSGPSQSNNQTNTNNAIYCIAKQAKASPEANPTETKTQCVGGGWVMVGWWAGGVRVLMLLIRMMMLLLLVLLLI